MDALEGITLRDNAELPLEQVVHLYAANQWSSANKPEQLLPALHGSHCVVTAWDAARLVGLGNALSDGHLVVYYPHLLVLPTYQGRGIGRAIMERLSSRYASFHQQVLLADSQALGFYDKCGFKLARGTQGMWIFHGREF